MKLIKSTVVVLSLLFGAAAMASGKIGVVDPQKIASKSKDMQQIRAKLEKEFNPRQQELLKLQKQLQEASEKLRRDNSILSKSDKTDLDNKIMRLKSQYERKARDYQQDFGMAQGQALQKMRAKVNEAIAKVAKKQGYDLVLYKEAAPYSNSSVDLTKQVLDSIN